MKKATHILGVQENSWQPSDTNSNIHIKLLLAFITCFHLIMVRIWVSGANFPTLIINHFLSTNHYKMPIFERSVTRRFFANCNDLLTRTQEKKCEDVSLVKTISKWAILISNLAYKTNCNKKIEYLLFPVEAGSPVALTTFWKKGVWRAFPSSI